MPLLTPEYTGPRNPARADAIIDFIERLPIVDGPAVGQRIKLDPFQIHWIRSIYEPGDRDNGLRVVKTAILSIARKNSKSYLVAGLLLCQPPLRHHAAERNVCPVRPAWLGWLWPHRRQRNPEGWFARSEGKVTLQKLAK